jgi:enediyne biosynthesis protein E4
MASVVRVSIAVLGAIVLGAAPGTFGLPQPVPPLHLVSVAEEAGIRTLNISSPTKDFLVDVTGTGAAFFDYDNDGLLDVLIVNASSHERMAAGGDRMVALYRNLGRGRFINVTDRARLTRLGWGQGVCIADYDNDGFQDIHVTAIGPNVLWRNNGDGTFTDVSRASGLDDPRWSTGCAFGDYDRDGYVDLYVANYIAFDRTTVPPRGAVCRFMNIDILCGPRPLPPEPDALYRNLGNGTFVDMTDAAGVAMPGHYGFGVVFADLDDDGWPDIYVANDSMPNALFHNQGDGTFVEKGLLAGVAVRTDGLEQAGMGVDAGDYTGDGRLDLVVTNFSQDHTTLYRNEGDMLFSDVSLPAGMILGPHLGWGVGFVDLDNDGLLDLFVANGHLYVDVERTGTSTYRQRNQIFRNLGGGRFQVAADVGGDGLQVEESSRGAAFGDYDNDGAVDVLVVNMDAPPTLLRNQSANGRWIGVRLVGVASNRDAIGARVTAEVGERRQTAEVRSGGSYVSHNDMRVRFGLGPAAGVDRLVIRWPSGRVETVPRLAANRYYVIREGEGVVPVP